MDHGDMICRYASDFTVYHSARKIFVLCILNGDADSTHPWKKVGWYSVSDHDRHLYLFIYKALMWILLLYKCASLQRSSGSYHTCSNKTGCHCKSLEFVLNLANLLFEFLCPNCLGVVAELPKNEYCDTISIHNHKPISLHLQPF